MFRIIAAIPTDKKKGERMEDHGQRGRVAPDQVFQRETSLIRLKRNGLKQQVIVQTAWEIFLNPSCSPDPFTARVDHISFVNRQSWLATTRCATIWHIWR